MSPDDEVGLAHRLGRVRAIAGAAGLAAVGSLAGCSAEPDDGPDPMGSPTAASASQSPSGAATPPTTTDSTVTVEPPTTTPRITLSTAECADQVEALEAELETVQGEIDQLEAELPMLRRKQSNLEGIVSLFDPPADDVVAQAEAVGTAAREAVVFLQAGEGIGTAWYVDDHHLVTNAHNVFDHHTGETRDSSVWTLGGEEYPAETVEFVDSLSPDVALLRTTEPAPASLTPGSTPPNSSTEPLVQVGHPGGIGNWMITLGNLRSVVEYGTDDGDFYVGLDTDIPGRQGVSGSPVLNLDGEVVGLTYAGTPVQDKQPDERPIVADPVVYDRPIASLSYGAHVAIDDVMAYYEEWT